MVLGGEKAMGWREMKVGSWVRLGKQLGGVWWLEVGLACWKGKREVCCGFQGEKEKNWVGDAGELEGCLRDAKKDTPALSSHSLFWN